MKPAPWQFVLAVYFAGYSAVFATDHYVSPVGGNVAPFTDWSTAATNIQAAIDAALPGDTVWVTNGIYNSEGTVAAGSVLTNRVALTKAITVQSVNGPAVTSIEGFQTPGSIN